MPSQRMPKQPEVNAKLMRRRALGAMMRNKSKDICYINKTIFDLQPAMKN